MGDKIVIKKVEFLYGHLFQIDLYNETKDEYYRTFIDEHDLQFILQKAKNASK